MKGNGHISTQGEVRPDPPMTHSESEQNEVIERYVRGKLTPNEHRAFEEHFFVCEECFQQVQMTERFVAGMRQAAETGKLSRAVNEEPLPGGWSNWLRFGFAMTAIATLILTAALAWLIFHQLPGVRGELAQERLAREQAEIESREQLKKTTERLEAERQKLANLERQLEAERRALLERKPGPQRSPKDQIAEVRVPQPNVPVAVLHATRGDDAVTEVELSRQTRSIVVWVEVESSRFESFRLQVFTANNQPVQTVTGLKRNKEGAVSAGISARSLTQGNYTVKVYGISPRGPELVGSYSLHIVKP